MPRLLLLHRLRLLLHLLCASPCVPACRLLIGKEQRVTQQRGFLCPCRACMLLLLLQALQVLLPPLPVGILHGLVCRLRGLPLRRLHAAHGNRLPHWLLHGSCPASLHAWLDPWLLWLLPLHCLNRLLLRLPLLHQLHLPLKVSHS